MKKTLRILDKMMLAVLIFVVHIFFIYIPYIPVNTTDVVKTNGYGLHQNKWRSFSDLVVPIKN
jgi:hypothetical protein